MAASPNRNLRVDDETYARWQAAAADAGYSLSEFIRAAVDDHLGRPDPEPVPPPLDAAGPPLSNDVGKATVQDDGGAFRGPDPKPERKR